MFGGGGLPPNPPKKSKSNHSERGGFSYEKNHYRIVMAYLIIVMAYNKAPKMRY